jgi:hypothetical protein
MIIRREYWEQMAARANELGKAKPIVDEIFKTKGISPKTSYRQLKDHGFDSKRKTRNDCGYIDPETKKHILAIAHMYHKHIKREAGTPLELVVNLYKKANPGVELPSVSHIHALFRKLGISRRFARIPTPKLSIKCLYPNHVHFYDTSICRYYLNKKNKIKFIPKAKNYKNKPNRFRDKQVLVRHIIIDGCTGAFFVWYTTTQRSIDMAEFLFNAWKQKGNFIFHGAPIKLVTDNDSGLRSHAFLRLLNYLEIDVPDVQTYAPWVKGYVEKMMHIWEIWFESRFLFIDKKIGSINQINRWAYNYAIEFQSTKIHSRHKMTRFQAWQEGVSGHLRELPDYHTFQKLLHSDPVRRKVTSQGIILKNGFKYKTKDTELFGKWVDVIEHPYLHQENYTITVTWPSTKDNPRNFLTPVKKKYTLEPYQKDKYGYDKKIHPWGKFKNLKHTDSMNNFKDVENSEIPQLNPFETHEPVQKFEPQTGEQIQPREVIEPKEIEYTKTLTKLHIADLLRRDLTLRETRLINALEQETFTKKDILSFVKSFKLEAALTKE